MGRRKKNSVNVEIQLDPTEIGKRAHEKWVERGCIDGYAQQDWLSAEAELKAEKAAACVVAFDIHGKKEGNPFLQDPSDPSGFLCRGKRSEIREAVKKEPQKVIPFEGEENILREMIRDRLELDKQPQKPQQNEKVH